MGITGVFMSLSDYSYILCSEPHFPFRCKSCTQYVPSVSEYIGGVFRQMCIHPPTTPIPPLKDNKDEDESLRTGTRSIPSTPDNNVLVPPRDFGEMTGNCDLRRK